MSRGRRSAAALVVAAALALSACGGDGESRFAARTDAVRSAVAAGDAETARAELDQLAVDAFTARDEGDIDDQELSELAALIATAEAQVDALLGAEEAPTTTAAPPPEPEPEPAPADDDEDEGGEDEGEGRGNDKKDKDKDDD